MAMYNPPHPGIILLEDWIKALDLSISEFALKIGTTRKNLSEIVNGKTGISSEMALKLSKALGTSAELWLNLQQAYDLWQAKQSINLDNVEVIYKASDITNEIHKNTETSCKKYKYKSKIAAKKVN